MIEKFEIKIVRLKTGEDLICFCYVDYKTNQVYIKYPKSFYYMYNTEENEDELVLIDWLPDSAFAFQDVMISLENTLFITFATIAFGYSYLKELSKLLPPKSDMAEKVNDAIEKFSIPDDVTLH